MPRRPDIKCLIGSLWVWAESLASESAVVVRLISTTRTSAVLTYEYASGLEHRTFRVPLRDLVSKYSRLTCIGLNEHLGWVQVGKGFVDRRVRRPQVRVFARFTPENFWSVSLFDHLHDSEWEDLALHGNQEAHSWLDLPHLKPPTPRQLTYAARRAAPQRDSAVPQRDSAAEDDDNMAVEDLPPVATTITRVPAPPGPTVWQHMDDDADP